MLITLRAIRFGFVSVIAEDPMEIGRVDVIVFLHESPATFPNVREIVL